MARKKKEERRKKKEERRKKKEERRVWRRISALTVVVFDKNKTALDI